MGFKINNDEYKNISDQLIKSSINLMNKFPNASGNWLCNLSYLLSTVKEIVVVGDPYDEELVELKLQIHKTFIPNKFSDINILTGVIIFIYSKRKKVVCLNNKLIEILKDCSNLTLQFFLTDIIW